MSDDALPVDWTTLMPLLRRARKFADPSPGLTAAMDGAQVEWRSRFTEHGLDLRDERDLHAFVAGLVSFAEYVEHVVLPLHVIRCATGENVSLESSLAGGVDAIVSTLRPYLEAHVPPGTIGAEGD